MVEACSSELEREGVELVGAKSRSSPAYSTLLAFPVVPASMTTVPSQPVP